MKVSWNWIRELAPVDADAATVAARLTAAGLEVEGLSALGAFSGVVVGEVRATTRHPKADKLTLVDVFDGSGVTQVVCGASNVPAPGGKVAWARPGARLPLPDGGFRVLEAREVRGVLSPGMLCAEDELGLGESHAGIIHLDGDAVPGADVAALLGLPDTIFELNVTPNRPDCMGSPGGGARGGSALRRARRPAAAAAVPSPTWRRSPSTRPPPRAWSPSRTPRAARATWRGSWWVCGWRPARWRCGCAWRRSACAPSTTSSTPPTWCCRRPATRCTPSTCTSSRARASWCAARATARPSRRSMARPAP